jgi:hypothetical protein
VTELLLEFSPSAYLTDAKLSRVKLMPPVIKRGWQTGDNVDPRTRSPLEVSQRVSAQVGEIDPTLVTWERKKVFDHRPIIRQDRTEADERV